MTQTNLRIFLLSVGAAVLMSLLTPLAFAESDWFPVAVEVHDSPFEMNSVRRTLDYVPLERASKPWRVCVSIPHLADTFWTGVNYGIAAESERLGVAMRMLIAGSYERLAVQREQVRDCLEDRADAFIIGTIAYDGLTDIVKEIRARGLPVVDLINGMEPQGLSARSASSYYDNALLIGRYLVKHVNDDNRRVRIAWFPGPPGAQWAIDSDRGLREAIKDTKFEIVETVYGNTSHASQTKLIDDALSKHSDVDYVMGSSAAGVSATRVLRKRGLRGKVGVLATYYGPGVHRGILRGTILASPTDLQATTSRIAVDQVVRILEGQPFHKHVGPRIIVVDRSNIADLDLSTSLAPKGFRPVYNINWSSE